MSSTTFPTKSDIAGAANDALNSATDAAAQAANKANEYGRATVDKLDAGRSSVAQGLHATADALRSFAPDPVAQHARTTAEAMESAADYISSRDIRSMASDLTEAVRRNPGPSLIAAVAIGFLLGIGLRRRD